MVKPNRWLGLSAMFVGGLIGGFLAVWMLSGPATLAAETHPAVTASRLLVVTSRGQKVGVLKPTSGGATLTLYDHGNATISLHTVSGVSGVSLFDQHGKMRAALEIEHDGSPVLNFYDEKGAVTKTFR